MNIFREKINEVKFLLQLISKTTLAITEFLSLLPYRCLELFLKTGVSLGPHRKALWLLNSA